MVHVYIVLDSPTKVFQPLDVVSGRVIVDSLKPLNAQSVYIRVTGKASVKFFRSSGNHTVTYKSRENYIQKRIMLWKKTSGDEKLEIGSHSYGFKFQLPAKCLPEFNNKIGKVTYKLKAVVDIPWGLNKSKEILLKVSPALDLTMDTKLLKPITFITQEPLHASATIQQRAFTQGNAIKLSVDIHNNTHHNITFVESGLKCRAYFKGQRDGLFVGSEKTKHMNSILNCKKLPFELPSGKEGTFNRVFTVPQCMPTISDSGIIKIEYFVFVKFHVNGIWDLYYSFINPNTPTCPRINIPVIIAKSLVLPPKAPKASKPKIGKISKDIPLSLMPHPLCDDYSLRDAPPSYETAVGMSDASEKENLLSF